MKCLLIVCLALTGALALPAENHDANLYNQGMFQGDIAGPSIQERSAIPGANYLWPNGVIPYVIDHSLSSDESSIRAGMDQLEALTCITFVPRSSESDYIEISSQSGCWSYVGRLGGMQQVSLQKNGCIYKGLIIHELMHAIGFWHEQTRPDRDNYVDIIYENITPGQEHNFDKLTDGVDSVYEGEDYNYYSIMHYEWNAFSYDPSLPTIVAHDPNVDLTPVWSRDIVQEDANQINNHYNCAQRK